MDQLLIVIFQAKIDQVTPSSNTLQDVLDVMAEGRDRLPDGGETFCLHQRLMAPLTVDRQRRLPANRHQKPERLLGKPFVALSLGNNFIYTSRGIEINGTEDGLPTNQWCTDSFTDTGLQNATTTRKPVVTLRIRRSHSPAPRHHQIHDTARNRHRRRFIRIAVTAAAPCTVHPWHGCASVRRGHQHTTTIGRHNIQGDVENRDENRIKRRCRISHLLADPVQRSQTRQRLDRTDRPVLGTALRQVSSQQSSRLSAVRSRTKSRHHVGSLAHNA